MDLRAVRRDWRLTVSLVSGGHFLSHFYVLSFPPLFPAWQAEFGLTNTELGLVMSAPLVASLFQLPVGMLVDRIGAKTVFVAGVGLTGAGIALVGTADSFLMMLGFAAVSGIGQSAFHPADYAMLESSATAGNKGKSFSVHSFSGFAGFAAAPVVVGGLSLLTSWRLALAAVGAFGVAYAALSWLVLAPRHGAASAGPSLDGGFSIRERLGGITSPTILVMFLFFITFSAGIKGIQTFTTVLMVDLYGYVETVGNTALTTFFVAAAGGILLGGVLTDRADPQRVIVANLAVAATVILTGTAVLFGSGRAAAVAAFLVAGVATGVVYPARDRLVSRYARAGTTGRSFGFVFTGTTIGGMATPPLLGFVIDVASPSTAFVIVGVAYLAAASLVVLLAGGYVTVGAAAPSGGD